MSRTRGLRRAAPLLVPLLLVTAVAGCTTSEDDAPAVGGASTSESPGPAYRTYAALGDSYTSAPYVPSTDLAGGCLRSSGNYPVLVATALAITNLRDVSCSGAETEDVSRRQEIFGDQTAPPQLRAVTPDTDLVTVSLGGNDYRLFGSLARTCPVTGPDGRPRGPDTGECGTLPPGALDDVASIGDRLARQLRRVERKAPDAEVVVVGYPRFVEAGASCPRRLPITDENARQVAALTRSLRDAMRRAAGTTGATFVDVYAASRGHGVCSDRPWVNGVRTDTTRAAALHPFPRGQQAVARLVEQALQRVGG